MEMSPIDIVNATPSVTIGDADKINTAELAKRFDALFIGLLWKNIANTGIDSEQTMLGGPWSDVLANHFIDSITNQHELGFGRLLVESNQLSGVQAYD